MPTGFASAVRGMEMTDEHIDATAAILRSAFQEYISDPLRHADQQIDIAAHMFWEKIRHTPPFDSLENKVTIQLNGYSQPADIQGAATLLTQLLLRGASERAAIEFFAQKIEDNAADVWEITEFKGVKVEQIINLSDNCWIYPNSQVPDDQKRRSIFSRIAMPGKLFIGQTAAIVHRFNHSPIILDESDRDSIQIATARNNSLLESRWQVRENLRRAAIICSSSPIELGYTYTTTGELSIYSSSMMTAKDIDSGIMDDQLLDFESIREKLRLLSVMKNSGSLSVAIDRLSKSRYYDTREDSAIDLGIAVEALLMHGEQESKSEIGFKLGLRAGWLLGNTVDERVAVKKRVAALYGARSTAAHRGRLKPSKFDQPDADSLVLSLINTLLNRGDMPDWTSLTFGGQSVAGSAPSADTADGSISAQPFGP
jgi:hypothetical protein